MAAGGAGCAQGTAGAAASHHEVGGITACERSQVERANQIEIMPRSRVRLREIARLAKDREFERRVSLVSAAYERAAVSAAMQAAACKRGAAA